MDAFNGYHIKRKLCATDVVYSDASDSGFGDFSALIGHHVSFGHWNEFVPVSLASLLLVGTFRSDSE